MAPLWIVLRVVNDAPQVQLTCVSTYSGWMSRFKVSPSFGRAPGRRRGLRGREPRPTYQSARTGRIPQNEGAPRSIPSPRQRVSYDVTTPLAWPVAVPSVADFGIVRSFSRAVQICWALVFCTSTRLGFAGS